MAEKIKRYTGERLVNLSYQQLKSMNNREFRRAVSDIRSIARKRVKSLSDKGYENTPALSALGERGYIKPLKGLTDKELLQEFYKARDFLRSETSTVKGVKNFSKNVSKSLGIPKMSYNELTDIFDVYNSARINKPNLGLDYKNVFKDIYDAIKSGVDKEDILYNITQKDVQRYESEVDDDDFYGV